MDRRDFLAKAGLVATWAGVSISVGACSDDDVVGPPQDVTGVIAENHGHTGAVVTAAQIQAGQPVRLWLSEVEFLGLLHRHSVDLTAQQVMDIGAGRQVQVVSSMDGHTHTVTFN